MKRYLVIGGVLASVVWHAVSTVGFAVDSIPQETLDLKRFNILSGSEFDRLSIPSLATHVNGSKYIHDKETFAVFLEEIHSGKILQPVYIYICDHLEARDQVRRIRLYGSGVVDMIVACPFSLPSTAAPSDTDLVWPGYDNGFINQLREARKAAGKTPFFSLVYLRRPLSKPTGGTRHISLEEVQWRIIAAVGANCRGIILKHKAGFDRTPDAASLTQLVSALKEQSKEVGKAQLVDWVQATKGQPVSALASDKYLFVALLNSAYMTLSEDGGSVLYPTGAKRRAGRLRVLLPTGLSIRDGKTLLGKQVMVTTIDREHVIDYEFKGGGEMLILPIKRDTSRSQPSDAATIDTSNSKEKAK